MASPSETDDPRQPPAICLQVTSDRPLATALARATVGSAPGLFDPKEGPARRTAGASRESAWDTGGSNRLVRDWSVLCFGR